MTSYGQAIHYFSTKCHYDDVNHRIFPITCLKTQTSGLFTQPILTNVTNECNFLKHHYSIFYNIVIL